jgi:hypothetical protein
MDHGEMAEPRGTNEQFFRMNAHFCPRTQLLIKIKENEGKSSLCYIATKYQRDKIT